MQDAAAGLPAGYAGGGDARQAAAPGLPLISFCDGLRRLALWQLDPFMSNVLLANALRPLWQLRVRTMSAKRGHDMSIAYPCRHTLAQDARPILLEQPDVWHPWHAHALESQTPQWHTRIDCSRLARCSCNPLLE